MGLGTIFTKKCAQSHVSSLWRLSQGFDGTWKVSTKRCDQLHIFFAVQTVFSFWWDLEKFQQKCVPSYSFFRCGDYLKFLMRLRKLSTKICSQLHVFSLWRLTWVFDGTWKNFHKKVCPVTRFFAVETNLRFWWDLEKFSQKSVPSYTFCSLWRLTWVFWWDLEKCSKKSVPSHRFLRCGD